MCYGTRTDAQKVERRGVFWLGRIHNCETKSSNILFLVLIKWKQNYPKDRIDRMSREPHYTPEELFVKFTEAGRVGQRQRPIDKKRLQEFLFLMSFLYYLATIGAVAGDSDNLFIFWTALVGQWQRPLDKKRFQADLPWDCCTFRVGAPGCPVLQLKPSFFSSLCCKPPGQCIWNPAWKRHSATGDYDL